MYGNRLGVDDIIYRPGLELELGIVFDNCRQLGNTLELSSINPIIFEQSSSIAQSDLNSYVRLTDPNSNSNQRTTAEKLKMELLIKNEPVKKQMSKKQNLRMKYKTKNLATMAILTATILVWCYSVALHTDSASWNKFMHLSNGNRSGKVKDFIDVMYQNLPGVLGVPTLVTQLVSIVKRMRPDVLFIGEADSDDIKAACPEGYNWVGGSLKNKKESIRVSAIVREDLPYKTFKINTLVPAVGLKIGEWKVVGIYREWSMCGDQSTKTKELQVERLRDFVDYWLTVRCKCICVGDFNFDPDPSTEYQRSLEQIRTCVNDVILPAGWRQIIRGPTRLEAEQEPALLDHCYVNQVDRTERTWNLDCSGYDHHLVGVRFKAKGTLFKAETFEYRNLTNVTPEMFQEAWDDTNPSDIFEEKDDPSEAVRLWEHKMLVALETVAPLQRMTSRPKKNEWFTKEHKEMCDNRDLMKREADLWRTREAKNRYKIYRNQVTNTLKKAKFDWTRDHLTVDDSKKWWARVKRLAGLVKVDGEEMAIKTEDGRVITKAEELAEHFNQFFKEKVVKLQSTIKIDREAVVDYAKEYMREKGFETPPEFSFNTVGTGVINKIITSLKNTSAQGRDQISTVLLKKFKGTIAPALRHIVNVAIKTGIYPSPWKVGLITPLPKSGDLSLAKNWRPVVINTSASKILEGVLQQQLQHHMELNQIYSPSQHAYRCHRSTESALLDLDTLITKAKNEGKVVALILTDMSAAFNLIKKKILLAQLEVYGFDVKARSMVGSYLSNRKTKCRIKGCMSGEVELDSGVGEGSVLGPGFFICGMCSVSVVAKRTRLEMAEAGFWIDAWTLEFADDTSGVLVCDDEAELQVAIHLMMDKFRHYFNSMGMCLNMSKCELIVFRSSRKEFSQTLPGGQREVNCVKLLGLHIDNSYKFTTHTEKVCQKLRFKLANLNRVRPYLSESKAKMITESLILSTINYMGTMYLRLPTNQRKIQKLMNVSARSVLKAPPRSHIVDLLRELYWLNATNLWEYLMICVLRRLRQGLMRAPVSYGEVFVHKNLELRRLRGTDLRVQWTRMNSHGLNSFINNACVAYNKYNLNPELFIDEETFKTSVKLRVFSKNENGSIK